MVPMHHFGSFRRHVVTDMANVVSLDGGGSPAVTEPSWGYPMRIVTRVLTAVVAVGLVLSAPLAQAAPPSTDAGPGSHAKGPKPGKGHGGDPVARAHRQLEHELTKMSKALDRAVKPSRIGKLSASTQAALQENVAADKARLDAVRTTAASSGDSAQLKQARTDVKKLRAVNYVLVVNVLRKAERLLAEAVPGSAAAVSLAAVVTEALTVDAATDRATFRGLRADLKTAKSLLEPAAAAPSPAR